ncbi:hypothetical protein LCGC14_2719910 [marine sediment metagenome]|uniref:Uncharacterized protein n=1 Tax=marine sediment metagenome TaxID=412755 RepID=A0A0F9BJI7_9ZZZZ
MKLICGSCEYPMVEGAVAVRLRAHGVYKAHSFHCPNTGCRSKVPVKAFLVEDEPYINAHDDAKVYAEELIAILEDAQVTMLSRGGDCACGLSTRELMSQQEK